MDREWIDDELCQLDTVLVERAVSMLREELKPIMKELRERIKENPDGWLMGRKGEWPLHMNWGMGVRNLLRDKGFGEKELAIENLDDYYSRLVELAAREG